MNNCFTFLFNIYNNLTFNEIAINDKPIPILTKYIQKYIIKLICQHINNFNKNSTTTYEYYYFFKENEKEINKLLLNISLVSHEWFEIVSNNINSIIGYDRYLLLFNYLGSINNYSIIKMSNIKYLIINISSNQLYSSLNFDNSINIKINNNLSNIKKLIITRPNYIIDKMPKSNNFHVPIFNENEIKCDLSCLNFKSFNWSIEKLIQKISKINSIVISSFYVNDNEFITNIFKHYKKSLLNVIIEQSSLSNIWPLFQNGSLSNIQSINIKTFITFKDIKLILKSSPKLRQICLVFCFHKLIYHFSNEQDKKSGKVINCTCDSLRGDKIEFHRVWLSLSKKLLKHGNIKHLSIGHHCDIDRSFWKYNPCNQLDQSNDTILNSFYNEISMLISSISSLKMFTLKNVVMHKIFEMITTKYKNKSIKRFQMISYYVSSFFIGSKFNQTISLFNNLKNDDIYSHIDFLKITNYNSRPGMIGYRVQEIYEFKKW